MRKNALQTTISAGLKVIFIVHGFMKNADYEYIVFAFFVENNVALKLMPPVVFVQTYAFAANLWGISKKLQTIVQFFFVCESLIFTECVEAEFQYSQNICFGFLRKCIFILHGLPLPVRKCHPESGGFHRCFRLLRVRAIRP